MTQTRVRGFAPWNPQAKTLMVLDQVKHVLAYYEVLGLLPLTARQVFYRLVGAHNFPKTEKHYDRLLEYLNRARRAGMIPWSSIRDDGVTVVGGGLFTDASDYLHAVQRQAARLDLDLLQHQEQHIEVMCEAAGMVPLLRRVARPYGVVVRSSGGFDSVTTKHDLACFYAELDKPVRLLHVGDLDPSGEHIHLSLGEDLSAFLEVLGGECTVQRVAVTAEQQARFGLATAPPKEKDKRSFDLDFTVQAEALDPTDLANLLRTAIEDELDLDAYREALAWQEGVRNQLKDALASITPPPA